MIRAVILSLALMGQAQAQKLTVAENASVTLSAPAVVRFGAPGAYMYSTTGAGTFRCGREYFGAGASPVLRTCTLHLINTATCTPRLTGGIGQRGRVGGGLAGVYTTFWCPASGGPRLRVMAGTWMGAIEAAKCVNDATETVPVALRRCASGDVMDRRTLLGIWSGDLAALFASEPS